MVKCEVKDGKIHTQIVSDDKYPVIEEVGDGVAELLAEFQAELIRRGESRKTTDLVFQEIISAVVAQNSNRVSIKVLSDNGLLQ